MSSLFDLAESLKQEKEKLKTPKKRVPGKSPKPPSVAKSVVSRAFAVPISYRVPGIVPPLRQPSSMTCWATVFTMMLSWRDGMSYPIEAALAKLGQVYVDKFKANSGLKSEEKAAFLAAGGLVGEPPMNYNIEGLHQLSRTYGPLGVTTDEAPGEAFAIHARIIVGMSSDGTVEGTRFQIVDPASGTEYEEKFAKFLEKYEEEARHKSRPLRIQVVHWPPNARVGQSMTYGLGLNRAMPQALEMPGELVTIPRPTHEPTLREAFTGRRDHFTCRRLRRGVAANRRDRTRRRPGGSSPRGQHGASHFAGQGTVSGAWH